MQYTVGTLSAREASKSQEDGVKPMDGCLHPPQRNEDEIVQTLARNISKSLNADVILYPGEINRTGFDSLIKFCHDGKQNKNIFFIIITFGGDPHAGFRIARTLGNNYEKVTIFIPDMCKSAGTLVALGADELVIAEQGELGPLDTQVRKEEELFDYSSGLDIVKAMHFLQTQALEAFRAFLLDIKLGGEISTKMSAEIATGLASGLFSPIYGQIDPVRLGEWQRAINIAYDYGKRLEKKNLKPGALGKLVGGYSNHGFAIDKEEAETLFRQIRCPSDDEKELANILTRAFPYSHLADFNGLVHLNGESDDESEGNASTPDKTRPRPRNKRNVKPVGGNSHPNNSPKSKRKRGSARKSEGVPTDNRPSQAS